MSTSLTVYHLPQCDTCRKAIKQLKEQGNELDTRHIVEQTPTAEQLRELIAASGLPLQKFFNVSGDAYRAMNLKDKLKDMSDEQKIELLASNGMLIKRPIVTDGTRTTVGYKEDSFRTEWRHG
ncbi:arsenate reductase family protein [Cohnella faecalis]|uniref:Arsenate reductase family protein n=1 Tax=Cohnella faecalis TaxID=2315694 RepID=A0A398CN97_9BACL|nr:arsenate reductase family protein [Cohnella faecalis]RIE04083.1 arsenate reductase family protein [Cohnella faecalis]